MERDAGSITIDGERLEDMTEKKLSLIPQKASRATFFRCTT